MLKVQKNDKAFKELKAYADSVPAPLKEVLLSDEHFDKVSEIFYQHMPKMVRFAMKINKFKEFYRDHRVQMVESMAL